LLATSFDPGVSVGRSNHLVGEVLNVVLGDLVFESTTNQSLGSKESVLRILYGLYNLKIKTRKKDVRDQSRPA